MRRVQNWDALAKSDEWSRGESNPRALSEISAPEVDAVASTLARIAEAHTEFLRVQGRGLELLRAYKSGSLPCPPSANHPV